MKAAEYMRYSTDNQDENSIIYQQTEIRKFCDAHGIPIVASFSDEGRSGTNMDRPGFRAMIAAAKAGKIDTVVIYDISRASRDVGDWFSFRKEMLHLGVTVISATGQKLGDMTRSADFLTELIITGVGQAQVLDTRQKSIDGVAVKAREGVFLGGVAPLGYDIVDGAYVINPSEAATVRTIFSLYADGMSYDDITDALHGALGKRGAPLGKNSYHSILNNERYIGVYTWNKKQYKLLRKWAGGKPNPNVVRIEGIIPPIIDQATWDAVQARMRNNKRNACNKATHEYLLSGLIECESCGGAYVGHAKRNQKGVETLYYVCGNKRRTRTCSARSLNARKLESFVVESLKDYLLSADLEDLSLHIANSINHASSDTRADRAELRKVEQKIMHGVNAVLSGLLVPELESELNRLKARKQELQERIREKEKESPQVHPAAIQMILQNAISNMEDPDQLKRVIRTFVPKIKAHADGTCTVCMGLTNGCGRGI